MEKDILGNVNAHVYLVEFQKSGLPHAHFLLIMEQKYKLTCAEQHDMIISAKLPNKKKYPELYKIVTKHMMHGLAGCLIHPICARLAMGHARIVTHVDSMRQQHRERIHTLSIGDAMMITC